MYTIATEAYKDKHYHAAVAFTEILVKMMKSSKNLEKPAYLQKFDLTLETAKQIHRKVLTIHDKQLEKWGPYGLKHRCRSEPFKSKMKTNITIPDEVLKPILDRETSFLFNKKWTHERIQSKRKKWNTVAEDTKENEMRNFIAPLIQAETLCNGTQLRVRNNMIFIRTYNSPI